MSYTVVKLTLTSKQISRIEAVVGTSNQFALLAHPQIRGIEMGSMPVYVLTPEQYKVIDPAIKEARALPAYEK